MIGTKRSIIAHLIGPLKEGEKCMTYCQVYSDDMEYLETISTTRCLSKDNMKFYFKSRIEKKYGKVINF